MEKNGETEAKVVFAQSVALGGVDCSSLTSPPPQKKLGSSSILFLRHSIRIAVQ
jgi:hypothetical protein